MGLIYLTKPATPEELRMMAEALTTLIKFAVDTKRRIAVGGGELHADCEARLLDKGSCQEDVWAAHIDLETGEVGCESMVNLRPSDGNASLEITDPVLRERVVELVRHFAGGRAHA